MSSQNPQDELARLMRESEQKAKKIGEVLDGLSRWNQRSEDLASAGQKVIAQPTGINTDYEGAIDAWQRHNGHQDTILAGLGVVHLEVVSASTMGTALVTGTFITTLPGHFETAEQVGADVHEAYQQLNYVLNDLADKHETLTIMRDFELAQPPAGKRSPIEQFETAWAAYDKPVTDSFSANTSLIPMRECIETAIDELLKRRQRQERIHGGWFGKIVALGKECGREGIADDHFLELAQQWQKATETNMAIQNVLSSAKTANYMRPQTLVELNKATVFLKALLLALDPAKLRPRS
jgi:hypothetical protein